VSRPSLARPGELIGRLAVRPNDAAAALGVCEGPARDRAASEAPR